MANNLDYLLNQQVSRQWRGMLEALASEFQAQIGETELRQVMHGVGLRFAEANPLARCNTMPDLCSALNDLWKQIDWGFADLTDTPDYLRIVHHCAPLRAFGANASGWSPAFLEGAYQGWLSSQGAKGLAVVQTSTYSDMDSVEFMLKQIVG